MSSVSHKASIAKVVFRNTGLFVSSRTLFSLAGTYGNDLLKSTVGRTNNGHTPIMAILICSSFGLLAFLGIDDPDASNYNQVGLAPHAAFGLSY